MECSICMGERVRNPVVTCCGHLFCWPCIYTWLYMQQRKRGQAAGSCPICKGALSLQAAQNDFTPIYMASSQQAEEENGTEDCIPPRPSAARRQHKAEHGPPSHDRLEEHIQSHVQEIDESVGFLFPSEHAVQEEIDGSVAFLFPSEILHAPVAQGAVQADHYMMAHLAQGGAEELQSAYYSPFLHAEDMTQLAIARGSAEEEVQSYFQDEVAQRRYEGAISTTNATQSFLAPLEASSHPAFLAPLETSNHPAINQHYQHNEGRTSTQLPLPGRVIVHHVQLFSPI